MTFKPPYSAQKLAEKLRAKTIETDSIMPRVLEAIDGMRDEVQAEIIGVISEVLPDNEYTVGQVLNELWNMADVSESDAEKEPTDIRIQLVAKSIVEDAYKLLRREESNLPPMRKKDAAFQQWLGEAMVALGFKN